MTKAKPFDPEMETLASQLGMRLHRRAGEVWAEDVQLTYRQIFENGVTRDMRDEDERLECGRKVLRHIIAARESEPSVEERIKKLLRRAASELGQPQQYRPKHWTILREKNLDELAGFRSPIGVKFSLSILLHGKHTGIKGEGQTPAEAIADLTAAAGQYLEAIRE